MSNTSMQVEISRLRAENRQREATLRALRSRLDETDKRARLSSIEARVIRLEAEDVELNRADEVGRLSKLSSDADVDAEISRMRANYKRRSGFRQLPIGNAIGGNALARGLNIHDLYTPPAEDAVEGTKDVRIWGESVARMALELEESGTPIVTRGAVHGLYPAQRRRSNPLRTARAVVKRFQAERSEVTHA